MKKIEIPRIQGQISRLKKITNGSTNPSKVNFKKLRIFKKIKYSNKALRSSLECWNSNRQSWLEESQQGHSSEMAPGVGGRGGRWDGWTDATWKGRKEKERAGLMKEKCRILSYCACKVLRIPEALRTPVEGMKWKLDATARKCLA